MLCAKCNNDNSADASFFEGCGAKLELVCPTCKTLASLGARFCKECGTALAATRPYSHPISPSESPIRVSAGAGSPSEVIPSTMTFLRERMLEEGKYYRSSGTP
jgi:double zinc ribbon protein